MAKVKKMALGGMGVGAPMTGMPKPLPIRGVGSNVGGPRQAVARATQANQMGGQPYADKMGGGAGMPPQRPFPGQGNDMAGTLPYGNTPAQYGGKMGGNLMTPQQVTAINNQGANMAKAHMEKIGAYGRPRMAVPAVAKPALGKTLKTGGTVSASKRADGIAQRGKTKGRMC